MLIELIVTSTWIAAAIMIRVVFPDGEKLKEAGELLTEKR
jgi:hypothetical protein